MKLVMKNTTIVLFGATGDLAKTKIVPALYRLEEKAQLEGSLIIGAAFESKESSEIIDAAMTSVSKRHETYWNNLKQKTFYKQIDFSHEKDFEDLALFVDQCERQHGMTHNNRLFYLAVGANFFCDITHFIGKYGLAKKPESKDSMWHRIVYEKPFGHDKKSAQLINECIQKWFDESQIYRIDHYLTKEVVSNIAMVRFTNCVFEPLWSNKYIDQVQIVVSETHGIGDRGRYYDDFGALRDVVQNHMLELLALICMETPVKLTGDFIRAQRVKILEKVRFIDGILGQYDGYKNEHYVPEDSATETYAVLKCAVDTPRWESVPFYLKTGKYLDKKEAVIHLKFKQVECLLMQGCPTESNWLTIKISPDAALSLTLNVKKPEVMNDVVPVEMEFCHSCIFGLKTPQAYEILLEEVAKGEQSISVRADEIEYAWNVIDTVYEKNLPVFLYQKGSSGPQEEKDFARKHGMEWRV
jgi:glucose-6-phosphate 1-dehydrogenase